jgi:hypothetical protein
MLKAVMILLFFPLLLSCNKLWDKVPPGGILTPPDLRLKEFTIIDHFNRETRHFFYYNAFKELDSLKIVDTAIIWPDMVTKHAFVTSFRITYKRPGRIDTVKLISPEGELVYKEYDFNYDKYGRIIRYMYHIVYWDHPVAPVPVSYTYNNDGTVIRNRESLDTAFYDLQQNVTNWNRNAWDQQFSYDLQLNPLFYVKNLATITEEGWFYEYAMSKHNVTHTQYSDGKSATYENIYDAQNRIIEKRFIEPVSLQRRTFRYTY